MMSVLALPICWLTARSPIHQDRLRRMQEAEAAIRMTAIRVEGLEKRQDAAMDALRTQVRVSGLASKEPV